MLLERSRQIADRGVYAYVALNPVELLNGLATLLALVLSWPIARWLGITYASFLVVMVLSPLVAGGLVSMGLFTSVLFPMFIYLVSGTCPAAELEGVAGLRLGAVAGDVGGGVLHLAAALLRSES